MGREGPKDMSAEVEEVEVEVENSIQAFVGMEGAMHSRRIAVVVTECSTEGGGTLAHPGYSLKRMKNPSWKRKVVVVVAACVVSQREVEEM
jgi:hypothetical protein